MLIGVKPKFGKRSVCTWYGPVQCLLDVMGLFKVSVSRNPRSQESNTSGHLSARPLLQLPVGSTAGDAGAAEHILWSFNIYDLIPGLHINNLWETFNTRSKKYKNKTSVLSFQFSHTNTWFFSLLDVRAWWWSYDILSKLTSFLCSMWMPWDIPRITESHNWINEGFYPWQEPPPSPGRMLWLNSNWKPSTMAQFNQSLVFVATTRTNLTDQNNFRIRTLVLMSSSTQEWMGPFACLLLSMAILQRKIKFANRW